MVSCEVGNVVKSLAGHDKDSVYLIVKAKGDIVWVCDGKHKGVSAPKKKNKKHIQVQQVNDNPLKEKILSGEVRDEEVKYFLKTWGFLNV